MTVVIESFCSEGRLRPELVSKKVLYMDIYGYLQIYMDIYGYK